ncbi:hypothetical protein DIZ81_10790 [Legionella taurinensis]|uniref:Tetratricopeptide repeat protein n=1 Tax=Legionella taurinensis TaxID=70611 RepID=A0A3A5LEX4_9GAMM|nr:hypothetical protein [Legionella taurinensis]MDX1838335.1 hypothetical protein [Legionella taurinensis]PUT39098.1 hypothetical protein DB744_10800 [Legionella taurinensis]PUT39552.1 hypothetical protein DB746_13455 [Legionella taurinensis]PUT43554.1 hypothetical protein DB743_10190 [Legionella taurinensis]PUT45208.1 hypothetical protein DB745_13395 [Legionella taurinensis]
MKDLISIDEFIEKHLSQDDVTMTGHINNNALLPEIARYFEDEAKYPAKSILTLRVKLFNYYSCMRNFDVCDFIHAGIINQLKDCSDEISAFQNDRIAAQYFDTLAYQYRNYKPKEDFKLSEEFFLKSEKILLKLLAEDKVNRQANADMLFGVMLSRFWLYTNYMQDQDKAKQLMLEIDEKYVTQISLPTYLTAYYFFVGCYYLNNKDYKRSVSAFKQIKQESTDETSWFFERLQGPIKEKLSEAESHLENQNNPFEFFPKQQKANSSVVLTSSEHEKKRFISS